MKTRESSKASCILISVHPEDRKFAEELAKLNGLELRIFDSCELAERELSNSELKQISLLFVELSTTKQFGTFSRQIATLIGSRSDLIHPNRVCLIADPEVDASFKEAISKSRSYGSILFRRYGDPARASRYFSDLLKILDARRIEEEEHTLELKSISEKHGVLEKIEGMLKAQTGFQDRMIQSIVSAVDELLMNAFIDAKEESDYAASAAGRPLSTKPPSPVEVRFRRGHLSASITVIDYHGTFDRFKALSRILRASAESEEGNLSVGTSSTRAGIGLAVTLRLGGSLSVQVHPGKRTEVTVSYNEAPNYREFRQQFHAIAIHSY